MKSLGLGLDKKVSITSPFCVHMAVAMWPLRYVQMAILDI